MIIMTEENKEMLSNAADTLKEETLDHVSGGDAIKITKKKKNGKRPAAIKFSSTLGGTAPLANYDKDDDDDDDKDEDGEPEFDPAPAKFKKVEL